MLDAKHISHYYGNMNKKSLKDRAKIIQLLCESNSLRSTARIMDFSINTITKLLVDVGTACEEYHQTHHYDLQSDRIQIDEIYSYVYARPRNVRPDMDKDSGYAWVFCALDPVSKFMVTWWVGARSKESTFNFVQDLRARIKNRPHITSDGFKFYPDAIEEAYGMDVDYSVLKKQYKKTVGKRFPQYDGSVREKIVGDPDIEKTTTAHIERANLTLRMGCRRFGRKTNAFSKKFENHCHALALHFFHYNYCRIHKTLRITPAMQLGLADHVWTYEELASM